ncbi:unnamed protein product [Pleuronectes platessa]|uniref:Uncharacterized protein n=1 Tax=Pleuronectes platessa TaxID=8262 RepID=A0A9N7TLC4_PLEPL|nr:unnamed protein product [Pleuronectes platessa]
MTHLDVLHAEPSKQIYKLEWGSQALGSRTSSSYLSSQLSIWTLLKKLFEASEEQLLCRLWRRRGAADVHGRLAACRPRVLTKAHAVRWGELASEPFNYPSEDGETQEE